MEVLYRHFEGDRFVDYSNWVNQPNKQLREIVGDLSKPENITLQKAAEIFGEAIHYLNLQKYGQKLSLVDTEYAINAFGFVVDNLVTSGDLKPEAKKFTLALNNALLSYFEKASPHGIV